MTLATSLTTFPSSLEKQFRLLTLADVTKSHQKGTYVIMSKRTYVLQKIVKSS